jgi:hypothetical protein
MTSSIPEEAPTLRLRGVPSFLGAPIADLEDVRSGDLCMVGLFYDHDAPEQFGGRFAARQIRYASYAGMGGRGSSGADVSTGPRAFDLGDLNVFALEPERHRAALVDQIAAILNAGGRPIIVGGLTDLRPIFDAALTGRPVAHLRTPLGASAGRDAFTLTIDLAPDRRGRPSLAGLRAAFDAMSPQSLIAAHLTGLAPDLDLTGQAEASFAAHVLDLLVERLLKGWPCR